MSQLLPRLSLSAVIGVLLLAVMAVDVSAGTLSCTVSASCAGTTVLKMSGTTNAHAEMPGQSNYSNLVCCSGVTGLGTSCTGNFVTVLKLSDLTNAHVEQNNQTNYLSTPCLSVDGGSISMAYQANNCTGYDTTLGSISDVTNAHVGDASAYTTKICVTATASSGTLTTDIVDGNGDVVASPAVDMSPGSVQITHQVIGGILGTATQKIRINNSTAGSSWNMTMAATAGSNSFWDGATADYDFNDPTPLGFDGGSDADSLGGQLTVDPTIGSITPQPGCANTGLTLGSAGSFNQSVTDNITLLTAGGTTPTNCYWDLTGIGLSQTIPAGQMAQSYGLPMTLTVTAM